MRCDRPSIKSWLLPLLAVTLLCLTTASNAAEDNKKTESPAETSPLKVAPAPVDGEGRNLFRKDLDEDEDNYSSEGRRVIYDRHRTQNRDGKDLFDWFGLGVGQTMDPYMAKSNKGCLNGDFAECFKSRALNTFADFFEEPSYELTESVRVVRMPRNVISEVARQPYEYSTEPRSEDTEWDQLVKFALRKAERFVKTSAFEVSAPSWLMSASNEVYAPRFLDEIADEIDVLENKKDTVFSRHRLRKILIPMLIVLKLFKLKLLLFLPLILGLASFKKLLGFAAIVVPGIIGFFKLYKPLSPSYTPPIYSPNGLGHPGGLHGGIGGASGLGGGYGGGGGGVFGSPYSKEGVNSDFGSNGFHPSTSYNDYGNNNNDAQHFAQELAYQAYARNNKKSEIEAETDDEKKSRK
ncbi:hypothetical protein TKK_0010731 [Trichogramma kaykai]|uniref:Osiris 2 n=1 Tax=Trichogramma kaykai TaxID=54128 RepID=A0ABD2WVQ4_9HYME